MKTGIQDLNSTKNEYYEVLQRERWSLRAQEGYRCDLEQFVGFIQDTFKVYAVQEITYEMLSKYQTWLFYNSQGNGKRYSVNTQLKKLSVVRSFFDFLSRSGKILVNPAKKIEMPKEERRLTKKPLTEDELERIFSSLNQDSMLGGRDYVVLKLLYTTGIRASELASIQLQDLDMETGMLRIVKAKGDKERFIPLLKSMKETVRDYLEKTRPEFPHSKETSALFLTNHGDQFSGKKNVLMIVKRAGWQAGIERVIGAHHFRVTCATRLMEAGADLKHIQELLGHEKLETLEHYLKVNVKNLKQEHTKRHPREAVK